MCTKCCISWSADAEMCKNTELESMDVGPKWKCNGESGSRNGNAAGSLGAVGAKECETSSSAGLLHSGQDRSSPHARPQRTRGRRHGAHSGHHSAVRRDELVPPAAAQTHLEAVILSEGSLKEEDEYMLWLICDI